MSDITFRPFKQQKDFLLCTDRIKGAFAGKRSGKTEVGAINGVILQEQKPRYKSNNVDPYLGVIVAPTTDMLRRLSLKKFLSYATPFIETFNKTHHEVKWHDGSEVYGISAEKPERFEGLKANWVWIDEVFQITEQFFLEAIARVSDQQGFIFCTGSLGVQYINPKLHWAYKYFKESDIGTCFEWSTSDNPHFPKEELEELKKILDIKTFNQMFTIQWDVTSQSAVFAEFSEANIAHHEYNPDLPTFVSIDWGWAHPMACLFFQVDLKTDTVYLFDEIVRSSLKIEDLWLEIAARNYKIAGYCCDIAGNQEREQTGISNVVWFKDTQGISFRYRSTAINYGIPIVRSYVRNGLGQAKFKIDPVKCKKSIDGIKNYRYPMKNGIVLNENPVKENDDAVDSIRYFFVNYMDKKNQTPKARTSSYA